MSHDHEHPHEHPHGHPHHDHEHGDHHHHGDHPTTGSRLPIHPAWFYGIGFVLVMLVVLVWTLLL